MDSAQKSRYISFNLDFDINPWSVWAESVGIKSTWINFALFTPEIFSRSKQINPRSYTMFANNVHIYERNFEIFKEIDKHSELSKSLDIHDLVDKNVYDNLMNL